MKSKLSVMYEFIDSFQRFGLNREIFSFFSVGQVLVLLTEIILRIIEYSTSTSKSIERIIQKLNFYFVTAS